MHPTKKKIKMINPKIFPTIMIILDILAAISYGYNGNIRQTIYWFAAAAITIVVTF
jgi:hypothetical protein